MKLAAALGWASFLAEFWWHVYSASVYTLPQVIETVALVSCSVLLTAMAWVGEEGDNQ